MTATLAPERHVRLAGTYNVRDIGGYPTAHGNETRWRTVLRGDSPHRLTAEDQERLSCLGLRTVIDLRRKGEILDAPNVYAIHGTVTYHNISLVDERGVRTGEVPTLGQVYEGILNNSKDRLAQVLAVFAQPEAYPVLVHCTAGKDRTGVVIAVLLALAGVPDELIAEDYALTSQYLTGPFFNESRERAEKAGIPWDRYQRLLVCPPDLILATLRYLHSLDGGVHGYCRSLGLAEHEIQAIRASIVA